MTTHTTPAPTFDPAIGFSRPEVAAAIEEHGQAQQLLAVLEEKVRDGDPGVKPAELRDAREMVGYAELRVQAAQRTAERREAEERAAAYAELGDRTRSADIVSDNEVVRAFADALTGLERLAQLTAQRSADVRDIARQVSQLVQIAERHGEREALRAAGIHNGAEYSIANGAASYTVAIAEGLAYRVTDLPPADALMAAWCRAMDLSALDRPEMEPQAALDGATRVIPALAEARPASADDHD